MVVSQSHPHCATDAPRSCEERARSRTWAGNRSVQYMLLLPVHVGVLVLLPCLRAPGMDSHAPARCQRIYMAASSPPPPSRRPYRKLAGRFMDVADDSDGDDGADDEDGGESVDANTPDSSEATVPADWSSRAAKHRAFWAQPEYRERVLSKRAATRAARQAKMPATPERPPLSESLQKRSDAMTLMRNNEQMWMERRLAAGAEQRAARADDTIRRRKQLERSKVAAKRHAARKAKAALDGAKLKAKPKSAKPTTKEAEAAPRRGRRQGVRDQRLGPPPSTPAP